MSIIKENNSPQEYWRKVTYTTDEWMGFTRITAHLPEGFTMREFTRMFKLERAKDYGITELEYLERQKQELFNDLIRRISSKERHFLIDNNNH